MWMNEMEIEDYAERFRGHPVLGPATRTLAALRDWVNGNSDGWPYWQPPARAAAKLMTLIHEADVHRRAGVPDAEPTAAQYKAALTPLRSFRTKRENLAGPGLRPIFPIYEAVAPEDAGVAAAEFEYEAARAMADEAEREARALRELADRAMRELDSARQVRSWVTLAAAVERGGITMTEDQRTVARLAKPGTRLWVLPAYTEDGYKGLGESATATGVTYGMSGAYIAYITDAGQRGRISGGGFPLSLADARERFWIVTPDGQRMTPTCGGHRSRERMVSVAAEREPGALVLPGSAFVPEA